MAVVPGSPQVACKHKMSSLCVPFERETVENLLSRNAIEFEPELCENSRKQALECLKKTIEDAPLPTDENIFSNQRAPKKDLLDCVTIYSVPRSCNTENFYGDINTDSDLVTFLICGKKNTLKMYVFFARVKTDLLYKDFCGKVSERKGFHTLETLQRDVPIEFIEKHGVTRQQLTKFLARYLQETTKDFATNEKWYWWELDPIPLQIGTVEKVIVAYDHKDVNKCWCEEELDCLYWKIECIPTVQRRYLHQQCSYKSEKKAPRPQIENSDT